MNGGMLEVVSGRHNAGIDPGLHVWGWEVPVYLFLGGLAAGLLIWSAWIEIASGRRPESQALRWGPWLAIVALTLGMGALFLDLAYKVHVWRFYLAFKPSSPMSWGSWILVLVYPIAGMAGLGGTSPEERALVGTALRRVHLDGVFSRLVRWADSGRRPWLGASMAVGIALGVYTGILLGSMASRPAWNSGLLGPLFLVSGLSTGAALLLLLHPTPRERHQLAGWDGVAMGVEVTLLALLLLQFATSGQSGLLALRELTVGAHGASFWSLVVIGGLLVPLAVVLLERFRGLPHTPLAPILVLFGGIALRVILVSAGQATGFRAL